MEEERVRKLREEQKRIEEEKQLRKQKEEKKRLDDEERLKKQMQEDRKSEQRETVVNGGKFNISTSLKKTSRMSSREDLRETKSSTMSSEVKTTSSVRKSEVGGHLRGLNQALEALAGKQQQQDKRHQLITSTSKQVRLIRYLITLFNAIARILLALQVYLGN